MVNLIINNAQEKYDDDQEGIGSPNYAITSYGADYPVDGLVKRISKGDIYIPEFQRGFIWDIKTASRFIESLIIGLPVPGIFLSKDQESKLIVIDGQQRLRTIQYFYEGKFPSDHHEKSISNSVDDNDKQNKYRIFSLKLGDNDDDKSSANSLQNKTYATLSDEERRRLDDAIIPATIIKQDVPEDDDSSIYQIFERLNTGGVKLTSQEIRACIYHGEFNKLLIELNKNEQWRKIFSNKDVEKVKADPRMKDQELILRFLALYFASVNYDGENDNTIQYRKTMKSFLNRFMKENRQLSLIPKENFVNIFNGSVKIIYDSIGITAFKPNKSLNAAVFDAVMVGIACRIAKGKIHQLQKVTIEYNNLLQDKNFLANSTQTARTTETSTVKARLKQAINAFRSIP